MQAGFVRDLHSVYSLQNGMKMNFTSDKYEAPQLELTECVEVSSILAGSNLTGNGVSESFEEEDYRF